MAVFRRPGRISSNTDCVRARHVRRARILSDETDPARRFAPACCSVATFPEKCPLCNFSPKCVAAAWRCCRKDARPARTAAEAETPLCTDQSCERRWAYLPATANRVAVNPPLHPCKLETKKLRHQRRRRVHPKNEFRGARSACNVVRRTKSSRPWPARARSAAIAD